MATFPNSGVDSITQYTLGKSSTLDWRLKLYVNNATPVVTSVAGDFVECSVSGYAAVDLTGSSWTGSTSSGLSFYTYPTVDFTFNSYAGPSQTLYGFYLVDQTAGTLLCAERFASSYTIPLGGGSYSLTLSFGEQTT